MFTLSFFRSANAVKPVCNCSVEGILTSIKCGDYAAQIEYLRTLSTHEYNVQKRSLAAVTPSGVFFPTRRAEYLVEHSSIVVLDFDDVAEPERLKERASTIKWCLAAFISPSGSGVKIFARTTVQSKEEHKKAFTALSDACQRLLHTTPDPSGKDVSRLCFVSFDEQLYKNLDAAPFEVSVPAQQQQRATSAPSDVNTHTAHRIALQAVKTAQNMILRARPGERHNARIRAACLVGGYVGAAALRYADAERALLEAALANTDNPATAQKDVVNGLEYGMKRPICLVCEQERQRAWAQQH